MTIAVMALWLAAAAPAQSVDRGVALFRARHFDKAEREFRRVLAVRPSDAAARLHLALALIEQDRIEESLAEIERVLNGQATAETRFQAGLILRDLAERRLAKLEKVAPDSASVHELAGNREELHGRLTEALREYRAAAVKEPARPGIHYRIGNVLWKQRELDDAARELANELEHNSRHGLANLRMGQVLVARGEEEKAIPYLELAITGSSASTDARRELGKAYRKVNRLADARREWEAVAAARPSDDQVHFLLGALYRDTGEARLSRIEFEKHRLILNRRQPKP